MRALQFHLVLPLLIAVSAISPLVSAQSVTVGGGASISLGAGTLNTGCGDLIIAPAGQLAVNSGAAIANRNVNISGGTLNGGSGLISLSGDWTNSGTFVAGSGLVEIIDGCGTSQSAVSGSSNFSRFSVASSSAKRLLLQAGSTQRFIHSLALNGVSGSRLEVRSTSAGSPANFILQPGANQAVSWVDVADNDATGGQTIAPDDPDVFDSIDSGGALNWFRNLIRSGPVEIDTVPWPGLLLLGLIVVTAARRYLPGRIAGPGV